MAGNKNQISFIYSHMNEIWQIFNYCKISISHYFIYIMGNCLFRSNYKTIPEKCTRCWRTGHHQNDCYASTYSDGSRIVYYCHLCKEHGHSSSACPHNLCTIL